MIASRRGLLVLLVIAVVLGAWLARALTAARPAPLDRAIAPGIEVDRVSELVWDRSPLPAVKITPGQGGGWRWESAGGWSIADGSIVRDVLAALRAGRWHRRADAKAAGSLRAQLTVKVGTTSKTIGIGQPLEGTEQQWLLSGEDALLVDRWIARALDPAPLALRVKHPVEDVASATSITIDHGDAHLRIEAPPWRLVAPYPLVPRQDAVVALQHALEALEIVRLSRPARDQDVVLSIHVGIQLRFAPACPDEPALAWLFSEAGNGCITRAAYDNVARAVAAFEGPAAQLVEPRLVPFDIETVLLVDGARLDLLRRPEISGKPADTDAVAELLAALAAPAQVVDTPGGQVKAQIRVTPKGGGLLTLELLGDGRVRRSGEPVVLQLAPAAYAALGRRTADLADRALWTEEATTISEVQIDGVRYQRGAVLGEWTRTPLGPVDGARLEALVRALAEVRGSPGVAAVTKQHDIALVVTPPAGSPVRHALVVGAPRPGGCPARAGQVTVILPAPLCGEIAALAR